MKKITEKIAKRQDKRAALPPKPRGFASMDPERQRLLAAMGGKKAHAEGRAHQFTREEARDAARKSVLARERRKAEQQGTAAPAGTTDQGG